MLLFMYVWYMRYVYIYIYHMYIRCIFSVFGAGLLENCYSTIGVEYYTDRFIPINYQYKTI